MYNSTNSVFFLLAPTRDRKNCALVGVNQYFNTSQCMEWKIYPVFQYVNSSSTLKYHIIGNLVLQTSMGAKGGWCAIRVRHYFGKDLFSVFYLLLCKNKLLGIISVGFDEMHQLMIIYFRFLTYLRGEGLQWNSA